MEVIKNLKKKSEEKLKQKEMQENNKSDKRVEENGKTDVKGKYNLSGPILEQSQIDKIVEKYKKK